MGNGWMTPYGLGVSLGAALGLLLLAYGRGARAGTPPADLLGLWMTPCAYVGARIGYCLAHFQFVFLEMGPLYALCVHRGGFLLWGAVLGAVLGAMAAARQAHASVARTLDRIAAPGLAVIAVCRLAEYFSTEGRGAWLDAGGPLCRFPFAVPDAYGYWQLAVFVWEAAAAGVIYWAVRRHRGKPGDRFQLALMLYSACQVVFESLRMDATPRIGFVRISQVTAGVVLLGCVLARSRCEEGWEAALPRGLLVALCLATVGMLEWALDKTPLSSALCYALMCLAMAVALRAGFVRREPYARQGWKWLDFQG